MINLSREYPRIDPSQRLALAGSLMVAAGALGGLIAANLPVARPLGVGWERTFSIALGSGYASGPLLAWVVDGLLPVVCFVAVVAVRRLGSGVREHPAWRPAFAMLVTWVVVLVLIAAARSLPPATSLHAINSVVALFILLCLNRARVGALWPYLVTMGALLWFGRSLHGVIHAATLGLALPVSRLRNELTFMFTIDSSLDRFETAHGVAQLNEQDEALATIAAAADAELSPARRAERLLAPFVAFAALPLVVVSRAGFEVGAVSTAFRPDIFGISLVGTTCWFVGVRFAAARLSGPSTRVALVASAAAFAMSLCVIALAYRDGPSHGTAAFGLWIGAVLGSVLAVAISIRPQRPTSDRKVVVLPFRKGTRVAPKAGGDETPPVRR